MNSVRKVFLIVGGGLTDSSLSLLQDYYKKWDHFEKDSVEELEVEEKRLQEESDRALGKDKAFHSEAEKKDMTTHQALKEAKKLWDKRRAEEMDQKFDLVDLKGVTKVMQTEPEKKTSRRRSLKPGKAPLTRNISCRNWDPKTSADARCSASKVSRTAILSFLNPLVG